MGIAGNSRGARVAARSAPSTNDDELPACSRRVGSPSIGNAGHWPQYEQTDTFNKIHLEFLLGQENR